MRNDWTSKLSASFMALAVVLSALVFIPAAGEGQTASSVNIYVPVISSGFSVIDNATVELTDVHTGSVMAAEYDESRSAYVVTGAPAGYYKVDVTHDCYYDYHAEPVDCFRFDATTSYTADLVILTEFPYKQFEWNVTVRNSMGVPIPGATVGFYDHNDLTMEFVEKGKTGAGGWALLEMWDTTTLGFGDISLVVVAAGYITYAVPTPVTGPDTLTIPMTASKKVYSFVTEPGGSLAENVVAYLVNLDDTIPLVKRVLKSTSSFVSFDAYDGDFMLVIDAEGCAAHVQPVNVPAAYPPSSIQLLEQTKRTEKVTMEYGDDFRSFGLDVSTTWSYDDAYPGLRYNDMGSLRMQIDLARGNGDGTLDLSTEVYPFIVEVQGYASQYVSSASLLTVNDTAYLSALSVTDFTLDLEAGSVDDETGVSYSYKCAYSDDTIDLDAPDYTAAAFARPDTPEVDYKYTINLVNNSDDYEMVHYECSDNVNVTGYQDITIDHVEGSSVEAVAMIFERCDLPSPVAEVDMDLSDYAYVVEDDGGNITGYIVRVDWNATFSAVKSTDPNGNPLTYTWDFGDGMGPFTTVNKTYVYNYSTPSALRVVTLTVRDVSNRTNSTTINVTCDELAPTPVISVKDLTINGTDNSVMIDQRDTIVFNATDSYDDVAAASDKLGVIAFFEFDYGDGNKSERVMWEETNKNVTHSYASSGNFTVVLNVTDVVGHWKNTTLLVKVNDTEGPKVSFTTKNATGGSSLIENKTVVFDANATSDNQDNITLLLFSWNFGDGTWLNGTGADGFSNVTHSYARIGQIQVVLNVTDTTGNYQPSSKIINIAQGLRPNMRIINVTFTPSPMVEDKTGHLIINLTNAGSAVATNVVVYVYMVDADGTLELLGKSSELINTTTGASVTSVEIGGTVRIEFPVSFKSKGTFTVRVNVTSDNQLKANTHVLSGDSAVVVEEAGWKKIALWGGVIGVIVLVPLALLLMRRRSRGDRGPRREKKLRAEEEK